MACDLRSSLWHEVSFSWGMWDPVPRPGIESRPLTLEVQSLSHWTTREVCTMCIYLGCPSPCWFILSVRPTCPRVDWTSLFSWVSQPLTFNMFKVELIISPTILFLFLQHHQPPEHPHRNPGIFPFLRVTHLITHHMLPVLAPESLSHLSPPHFLVWAPIVFHLCTLNPCLRINTNA